MNPARSRVYFITPRIPPDCKQPVIRITSARSTVPACLPVRIGKKGARRERGKSFLTFPIGYSRLLRSLVVSRAKLGLHAPVLSIPFRYIFFFFREIAKMIERIRFERNLFSFRKGKSVNSSLDWDEKIDRRTSDKIRAPQSFHLSNLLSR